MIPTQMRLRTVLFCGLAFLGAACVVAAQASSIDWKFYGGTESDWCFYESRGMVHSPDGNIKVWVKCLVQKDMDAVDVKTDYDGKILEDTAQKVAKYYVPPIALIADFNADQMIEATRLEVTANISLIQPRSSIFYELNCRERLIRELSISISANGKSGYRNKPSEWKYIAPEGNVATLRRLLCPAR